MVSLTPERLEARVTGESFDPARHPERTAVKAATYHQLSIVPAGDGWQATVVLDCNHFSESSGGRSRKTDN